MPDLYPPGLVEMITEMERDLLARARVYHNRTYTRRLSLERAERRLEIVRSVIGLLREQATDAELTALQQQKDRKKQHRQGKRMAAAPQHV